MYRRERRKKYTRRSRNVVTNTLYSRRKPSWRCGTMMSLIVLTRACSNAKDAGTLLQL